jgi:uncharacterized protein (DUF1684 family)
MGLHARRALVALTILMASVSSSGRAAETAYEAEIRKWREAREARLKSEEGWLAVAGLFWLEQGANRFGTAAGNQIVLPEGSAPPLAGVFEHHAGKTTVRIEPGVVVTTKGAAVTSKELTADTAGEPDVLVLGRLTMHVIERGGRYGIRLKDKESLQRKSFAGLQWFPVKDSYRFTARFVPYDPPRSVPVPNVLGQVTEMPSPGHAVFEVGGKQVGLDAVLEEPDAKELFFIFRDLTTGKETYGAGRFLYSEMEKDGTVVLDFNKAYSPPCAYTPYATCPLPPKQNRLSVRIEAGEKHSGHH